MITACIISFIVGALIMMCAMGVMSNCREEEPRNQVHFYAKAIEDGIPWLYIQRKDGELELVACTNSLEAYGLNPKDFANMKKGEKVEVFISINE